MEQATYLFVHAHLLTLQGEGVGYIADGAVAVNGNRIVGVGTTDELTGRFQANRLIDVTGKAIMPGLIDAHMHTPLAVVRGVAQDVNNWMQAALAPYSKYLSPEASLAGTGLDIADGIRSGTTTFGDYAWPNAGWAETFAEAGVRARLTPRINAFPKAGMAGWKIGDIYPLDEAEGKAAIDVAMGFADDWHGQEDGRITVMIGPQGPDMIGKGQLLEVKRLAESRGLMLHVHVAQGDREIDQMVKRFGVRTPEYLQQIGYLDDQLLAVHLTEATDAETEMIAKSGARLALCSGSIGIIDGIVPPAHVFRQAGGPVCLGSDQASGNNNSNIFNEMKLTALFNKIKYRNPTIMPAWEVLRMGTIEGAQAIGLADEIGSLEEGKKADLIVIDTTAPNLTPILQDPIRTLVPNLIYGGTGREVDLSMIDGKIVMEDGQLLTINEAEIQVNAQRQAEIVARHVAADPVHESMALLVAMADGNL